MNTDSTYVTGDAELTHSKAARTLELTRLIVDRDPRNRELGAEECTDYISSYSSHEVRLLCAVLTMCAIGETDVVALESQLHALNELDSTGHVRPEDLEPLSKIDRTSLPMDLDEYIEDLLEG